MKIAVLHDKMATLSGGNKCSLDTARALSDKHDIYLYSYEKPDLSKWGVDFPFKWVKLPYLKFTGKMFVYRKLKEMLKFHNWFSEMDIVISTFGQTISTTNGGRFFQWMYFPFINQGWNLKYKVYRGPFDYLMNRTLKNTEKILVFSRYVKRVVTKYYQLPPEKIEVVNLSIDTNSFPKRYKKIEKLVVTISSFCRWKHLEKVNQIARLKPDFGFYVIGRITDPNYFSYLQSIQAKNVQYLVDLPNEKVKELLASARYYLHVNYNDGSILDAEHFGIALIEGLAAGCTVFSHNSGGPIEILDKGRCGVLYEDHLQVPGLLGNLIIPDKVSQHRANDFDFSVFKHNLERVLFQ